MNILFRRKKPSKDGAKEVDTKPPLRDRDPQPNPLSRRFSNEDDKPTRVLNPMSPATAGVRPEVDHAAKTDPATRIMPQHDADEGRADRKSRMDDPPAGWLVVVEGAGRGNCLVIGYGMNTIGRAASQRLIVDFGDVRISRENHAMVTYEPKSRRFYLQHGGGPNLTYLGEDPVLMPKELSAGDDIRMGDTVLRFFPLCSESFDWFSPH